MSDWQGTERGRDSGTGSSPLARTGRTQRPRRDDGDSSEAEFLDPGQLAGQDFRARRDPERSARARAWPRSFQNARAPTAGGSFHASQPGGPDRRVSGRDGTRFGALAQGRRRCVGRSGAAGAGESRGIAQALRATTGAGIAGRSPQARGRRGEGTPSAHSGRAAALGRSARGTLSHDTRPGAIHSTKSFRTAYTTESA